MKNEMAQLIRQAHLDSALSSNRQEITVGEITVGEQIAPNILPEDGEVLHYSGFKHEYGAQAIFYVDPDIHTGHPEFVVTKIEMSLSVGTVRITAVSAECLINPIGTECAQTWTKTALLTDKIEVYRPRNPLSSF